MSATTTFTTLRRATLGAATLLALLALLALAALASPAAARAQAPGTPAARLETRLDPATRDSVAALIAEAKRRRLPTEPLVAKALEGIEKGADGAHIVRAVSALMARLEMAKVAIAPAVNGAEVAAAADALAVGVPDRALRQLREISPRRSTAVALGVLTQLVSRKVPVEQATDAVMKLLQRGGGTQQLLALERGVNGDIAVGMNPDAALDLRSRAIIAALPVAPAAGATAADASTLSTQGASPGAKKP